MLGSNMNASNDASTKIYIRDLLEKKIIEETDIIIIEDAQNTKRVTVQDFVNSIVKDEEVPTRYRIYSSKKIQGMIDELSSYLETGVGRIQDFVLQLEKRKADRSELKDLEAALIAEIDERADKETIISMIEDKMDKNHKFTAEDMDISSDEYKIKLKNLSKEVIEYMIGGTPIPSNRPPKGGWVTEDFADESITFKKLADDYRYGGHFIEGNINEFTKDGIYTLGSKVYGLPKEDEDDDSQIRLLTITTTENDIIKQKVEYVNDLKYRPIYRRVASRNRLRATEFIRVEEINNKFKAHRDLLSDDFNNCGELSGCDIFTITREGHYLADGTVTNLPTFGQVYEVDIRKFSDRIIYQAIGMGDTRCDVYQAMQYYTTGANPVNTQWFNTSSYSRSKFEGKTAHLFGDGIIFGLGSDDIPNKSIPALLSRKYGLRIINNALGDATAGAYDDETLAERSLITQVALDPMDDADYAIIMIGTHDWDCGKASIGRTTHVADTSFKGALNMCIMNILSKNARTKILLVTPFYRSRLRINDNHDSDNYMRNDLMLRDFVTAIEEIGIYNHIPSINLYDTCGINRLNSTAYLKDGLYLNDDGHELIADRILDGMNRFY